MRLCTTAACWILFALVPITGSALGLGNISLDSALNEPFAAEIPLQSLGSTDLNLLNVSLATNDTFKRYDLDKPEFLNDFKFTVVNVDNGQPVIRVTSIKPVPEPFVTFLVDVKWASGRLLREYTVLLDPPVFEEAVIQQQSIVKPALTATPFETDTAGQVVRQPLQESVTDEPAPAKEQKNELRAVVEPEPEQEAVAEQPSQVLPEPQAQMLGDSYMTQRGDTLWSIANRTRGDSGLTMNQMMLALFRANPEAFLGNINALKSGSILRIPEQQEAGGVGISEATNEAVEQHAAWAGGSVRPGEVEPVGDQLQLVAPTTDYTADSAQSFVNADVDSEGNVQSDAGVWETGSEKDQRLLQVQDDELSALQERIVEAEQTPVEGDVAIEEALLGPELGLQDEEIIVEAIDEPVGSPFVDDSELLTDNSKDQSAQVEAMPVEDMAGEPTDTSKVVQLPEQGEASLVDTLMGWAVGACLLLLVFFLVRRRTGTANPDSTDTWDDAGEGSLHDQSIDDFADMPSFEDSIVDDEIDDALAEDAAGPAEVSEPEAEPEVSPIFDEAAEESMREAAAKLDIDSPVDFDPPDMTESAASPDVSDALDPRDDEEGELPLEKTISTGAPLNLDNSDPIAEAEFHMAYGFYDQAANLLVRALEDEADNRAYRVKLIEVYFVWENKEGFLKQATALHESITDSSDSDWSKVLILGKQLCPDAELFAGSDSSATIADAMDLELSDIGDTGIDFSLGGTEVKALDEGSLNMALGGDLLGDVADQDLSLNLGSETSIIADTDDLPLNLDELGEEAVDSEPEQGLQEADADTFDATLRPDEDLAVTMESPTLEVPGSIADTSEMPVLNEDSLADPASLDIDLSGLANLSVEDEVTPLPVDEDGALNQLDNIGEFLTPKDMRKSSVDDEPTMLSNADDIQDMIAAEETDALGDTLQQPSPENTSDGDTAEQPEISVDDELGMDAVIPEDATMTEVGTKLDLARAYIDMGDPDGARSILNEVIEEGGESQQQEARQLLEELGD
ncbi:MAG: hypothetical protein GY918_10430 [Gammaproteobacteria bacterium]|nr:hypothetical protein [Gammaproteobacteria bacterium]